MNIRMDTVNKSFPKDKMIPPIINNPTDQAIRVTLYRDDRTGSTVAHELVVPANEWSMTPKMIQYGTFNRIEVHGKVFGLNPEDFILYKQPK